MLCNSTSFRVLLVETLFSDIFNLFFLSVFGYSLKLVNMQKLVDALRGYWPKTEKTVLFRSFFGMAARC